MARKAPIRIVLEELSNWELAEFLEHQELAVGGNKPERIQRLIQHHRRDLEQLMHQGPWPISDWNEFAGNYFDCAPRKSYTELAQDLLLAASPQGEVRSEILDELGSWSVAEVREDDDLGHHLTEILGCTTKALDRELKRHHGLFLISSIVDDLLKLADGRQARAPAPEQAKTKIERPSPVDSDSLPEVRPGELLDGGFIVVGALGAGGFGGTFEVVAPQPRVTLVAKFPRANAEALESIRNEVEKVRLLSHPSLCRIIELRIDARFGPFILMEHGGRSVRDYFEGDVAPIEAVTVVAQVAAALDYLHRHDVVHGDVNPGNVLIDATGRVRLTDFGLAGFLIPASSSVGLTRIATSFRGKHPQFSAIEVLQHRPPNRRSDQWSLAVLLEWMVAGPHFETPSVSQVLAVRLAPRSRFAVQRAKAIDPAARFTSCSEFVSELRDDQT